MRKRRIVIALVILLLLAGIAAMAWEVVDWPPPRLILKYGFPPTGGPTGNVREIEGIEFVELKPGYFRMGSHYLCEEGDLLGRISAVFGLSWGTPPKHDGGECPTRWVEIRSPFWIAATEITNAQFEMFCPGGVREGWAEHDDCPASSVGGSNVLGYCLWLSEQAGVAVRLPSEAEWEYACRAGTDSEFSFGDEPQGDARAAWTVEVASRYACFGGVCERRTQPVRSKKPNAWGLYDMHGNTTEWCQDTWHPSYEGAPVDGTARVSDESPAGVYRGGDFDDPLKQCRSASRPSGRESRTRGLRPVFTLPEDE